jgi:hypothetical protein
MGNIVASAWFHVAGMPFVLMLVGVFAKRLGRRDGDDSPRRNDWAVGTTVLLMLLGTMTDNASRERNEAARSRLEVERSISRLKFVNWVRIAALPFAAFSGAVAAATAPIAFPIGAGGAAAAIGVGEFLARRERTKLDARLRDLEARHILGHEEVEKFLSTANSITVAGPAM